MYIYFSVVTRQSKNIGQTVISSRHWKNLPETDQQGSFIQHERNCLTCARMTKTERFSSQATNRSYKINQKYNCNSSWCIYLATCLLCKSDYVGQTWAKKGMRGRHLGHRSECKSGSSGLGKHFKEKHGGSTDTLQLIIIDSVKPGNHEALDKKEAKWIHQLKTMDDMGFGGMNLREDLLRNSRKLCTCGYYGN